MSETQFLDLTSFGGLLDRLIMGMRSAPPTAEQQRWMAEQVGALLEEIAARAPSTGETLAGEWDGYRTANRLALNGPGSIQISAVFRSNKIHTAWIDLNDVIWQVDANPTPEIALRITISRGHKVQSAYSFTREGGIKDDRDWNGMMADTAGQLQQALQSAAAPDLGQSAGAGVLPHLEPLPVDKGKGIVPMPDISRAIQEIIEHEPEPPEEPAVPPDQEKEEISETVSPVERTVLERKPPPQWELLELTGPQIGTRHTLKTETILGRKPDCDIVLADPSISRKHTQITQKGQVYAISDLGSSNGTFVNGVRIQHEVLLKPGDQVRLGDRVLQVSLPAGEESPALATVIGKAPLPVVPAVQPLKSGAPPAKPATPPQRQAAPAKPAARPPKPLGQPQRSAPRAAMPSGQPKRETPPAKPAAPSARQVEPPATVTCSQCGTVAKYGIHFCRNCGTPLAGPPPVREKRCPYCQQPIGASARFCRHCGRNLPD
ncbi:MAG: FHA domain-containing protein [Anaerolineales bacterium]|nr:FHA domain-containing protein [Anaerolineales bacterium]